MPWLSVMEHATNADDGKVDKVVSAHEDVQDDLNEAPPSDRSFGLVFTGFFILVGLVPLLRGRPIRLWALVVSGGFALITLIRPALFSQANKLWMKLARLLSRIVNPVVMAVLFFVLLTPMSMLLRVFGKDPLRLKPDGRSTYWVPRNPPGPGPGTMKNQF